MRCITRVTLKLNSKKKKREKNSKTLCKLGVLRNKQPISVVAPSVVWVCGRWLAGIVGSNPSRSMDIRILWVFCLVR